MTLSTLSTIRPAAARALRLDFFGGPILWRGEIPVRISPFQAGLLSLALGVGRSRIPRSLIQSLLWNGDGDKAVRHRLSQLVYQTNQRCRTRVVKLEGEYLHVDSQAVVTDLDTLTAMIRASDFKRACDIFECGFLSAFPNRRTEAFTDWIEARERGLRARLRDKALADWSAFEAVHDWFGARACANALSRLDPGDDTFIRRVMGANTMGGRVGEAATVYRSLAERVDPSGECSPEQAPAELPDTLQSVDGHPSAESGTGGTPEPVPNVPFTGRTDESARLEHGIDAGGRGRAWSTITVSGEAGLGKTRLIGEVLRGVHARGLSVFHARPGRFERDIPLSSLLEALKAQRVGRLLSSVADPWRTRLLTLLPQFDTGAEPPEPATNGQPEWHRYHTSEALLRLFRASARSGPTVVVLDDFHWADEATVTTLQFLQRRWRDEDLTLLLTYRTEELGRNRSAARLVSALESEPNATAIRLGELEEEASRALVSSMGPKELSESTISDIVALAGGNPRFLIGITADVMNGTESTPEVRVPAAIGRDIVRRIDELEPSARKTMSALAVFADPATVRCIEQITGQSRHRCIDALDLLGERRLVEWKDGQASIRHEIVRRAVYEGLSPTRRALLHALSAEALRSRSRNPRPERIAMHYHRAGERQLAHFYALEASKPSASRTPGGRSKYLELAYETAEESQRRRLLLPLARALLRSRQLAAATGYARTALEDLRDLSPAESSSARLLVAEGYGLLGRDAPATTLDRLAGIESAARRDGDEKLLAEVLDARLRVFHRAGDNDGARRVFDEAKRMEGLRDPAANSLLQATLAMQAQYNDVAEGLMCARRAVTIAREHDLADEEMLARQRHVAALAASGLLASEEGRTSLAEAGTTARSSENLASHLLILLEVAGWHTATRTPDMAAAALDEALVLAERTDCPNIRCLANLAGARLALARGKLPAAIAALRGGSASTVRTLEEKSPPQGVNGSGETGEEAERALVPPYLAGTIAGLEGNVVLESGRIFRAMVISKEHPIEEPLANVPVDLVLFHARLLSRKGNVRRALKLLARGAEAHEADRPLHWLRIVHDIVRLGRRTGSPKTSVAAVARDRALHLDLRGLAHEFIPFLR